MTHRIISSEHPDRIIGIICGWPHCICRTEYTDYRGPVAFIGAGRVWGVADLHEIKPVVTSLPKKGVEPEKPTAFLWCFENLREVEAIPCAVVAAPAMFDNGGKWEPLFLQASAQALLNRALSPMVGQEEAPEGEMTQVLAEAVYGPKLAIPAGKCGQLEMF
jgi:hypothetical protein